MTYYDDQLRQLQAQRDRLRRLEAMEAELCRQRQEVSDRVYDLEQIMNSEQADVAALEGRSLAAFFYNVIGKLDDRLTKEREEAYAARVKYAAAARELAGVEEDLHRCQRELEGLRGCDQRYADLLAEKAAAIKVSDSPAAQQILDLETRQAQLGHQLRELSEAIAAGELAQESANQVLAELNSADSWATFDLLGGGIIADAAKYDHLDRAQYAIEDLQDHLRHFQTELADVRVELDTQINVDGFLRFADYFFDNFFTDWAVRDQIGRSKSQIRSTLGQIEEVLDRLNALADQATREQSDIQTRLDDLIRQVQM